MVRPGYNTQVYIIISELRAVEDKARRDYNVVATTILEQTLGGCVTASAHTWPAIEH